MPEDALGFDIFDIPEGGDILAPFEDAVDAPAEEVAEEAESTEEVETPQDSPTEQDTPTEESDAEPKTAEPKKFALGDDDFITITQDGKEIEVRWGDYKGSVMRQADYTRKTQAVKEKETALQSREQELTTAAQTLEEREARILRVAEALKNPNNIKKLYRKVTNGQDLVDGSETGNPPKDTPTAPATKEEMLAVVEEKVQAELQKIAEKQLVLEAETFKTQLRSTSESTIDAILDEHKDTLGDVPYVDRIIKAKAGESNPTNIEELKAALIKAGNELAAQFAEKKRETKKQEAVKQTKLRKGIEPAGGAAPAQKKKTYEKPDGKVDWDAVDKDAEAFIRSISEA